MQISDNPERYTSITTGTKNTISNTTVLASTVDKNKIHAEEFIAFKTAQREPRIINPTSKTIFYPWDKQKNSMDNNDNNEEMFDSTE